MTIKTKQKKRAPFVAPAITETPSPARITPEVRMGDTCPNCGEGQMDYDGLLNLVCPRCNYTLGGSFT